MRNAIEVMTFKSEVGGGREQIRCTRACEDSNAHCAAFLRKSPTGIGRRRWRHIFRMVASTCSFRWVFCPSGDEPSLSFDVWSPPATFVVNIVNLGTEMYEPTRSCCPHLVLQSHPSQRVTTTRDASRGTRFTRH